MRFASNNYNRDFTVIPFLFNAVGYFDIYLYSPTISLISADFSCLHMMSKHFESFTQIPRNELKQQLTTQII